MDNHTKNLMLRQALEIAENVNALLDQAFAAHTAYVAANH